MNLSEMNKETKTAVRSYDQKQNILTGGNWETSAKSISKMALPKALAGSEESFLQNSEVLRTMLGSVNMEDVSVMDLVNMSMGAKAIEEGDVKAATYFRDTAGGKPVEKIERNDNGISKLTDEQVDFLLANAKVVTNDE